MTCLWLSSSMARRQSPHYDDLVTCHTIGRVSLGVGPSNTKAEFSVYVFFKSRASRLSCIGQFHTCTTLCASPLTRGEASNWVQHCQKQWQNRVEPVLGRSHFVLGELSLRWAGLRQGKYAMERALLTNHKCFHCSHHVSEVEVGLCIASAGWAEWR